ncbi:GNAT family N-acetyltransferase [Paraburkholderia sp. BCC1885]|uniref:GNAT family N-acetyltransferase n=1 Tax=Paraburkholderia sp. BCC1885 TaxID=2562669 RepID=UPI001181C7A4|nr:GNAT family N-acetyltransferase [Paraburkholderia sp. BCC1885]
MSPVAPFASGSKMDLFNTWLRRVHASSDLAVGIGGLNVDPYRPIGDTARLRRLYVANDFRRQGVGEALVGALLKEAPRTFRVVRLSTDTEAAAAFYARLGFSAIEDETATHVKIL